MGYVVLAAIMAIYFSPAIIAFIRRQANRYSVLVVNLFFGWTVVGWVVALAMSVGNATPAEA